MMKKYLLPVLVIAMLLSGCYHTTAVILPPETTTVPSGTGESISDSTTLNQTAAAADTTANAPESIPETTAETQSEDQTAPSRQESKPQSTGKSSSSSPNPAQTQTEPTTTQTEPNTAQTEPAGTSPGGTEAVTQPQTEPSAEQTEPAPVQTEPPADQTEPAPVQTEPVAAPPDETEAATQPQHPVYDISSHSVGSLEKAVLEAINAYRTEAGLSELSLDKKLSALATIRAYECSQTMSSTRPDGRNWKTVLSDYGYGRRNSNAESRLYCTQSFGAELIVETWMNSSQKDNILSESFTHAGAGIYKANGRIYVVVIYAG